MFVGLSVGTPLFPMELCKFWSYGGCIPLLCVGIVWESVCLSVCCSISIVLCVGFVCISLIYSLICDISDLRNRISSFIFENASFIGSIIGTVFIGL